MANTKKAKKGPGYEYWSKRPGSRNHGQAPGRKSKKLNISLERIEGKEEMVDQLSKHYEGEIADTEDSK